MSKSRQSYVYIMTNTANTVLYTGVTGDLVKRVWQHREGTVPGFTLRYRLKKLVYYELFGDIRLAIEREKQIKGGSRRDKIKLVKSMNPEWRDLGDGL